MEFSAGPYIIRANQRDEEYKLWLKFSLLESLELILRYKVIHDWRSELSVLSDLTYYLTTTMLQRRTLGE